MVLLSDQLQISVWDGSVLAIHNGNAILPCQFFGGFLSNQIIILWQRVETKEILWSYYLGENQLNQQSLEYSGRVSLFPEELKRGNASLKLENIKLNDTGKYMCSVRIPLENSTGILSLQIADTDNGIEKRHQWILLTVLLMVAGFVSIGILISKKSISPAK
ncbi:hypothetical protein chiPu_0013154 [Chiloscyllium punctatum]|uniref:Ig-like domain-containing protein n=1 Tax=Chiloscyllium punctatum TaxID=137246 RepID=A0A401SW99_CHIPU|nr:hypothetical protein [Chiloscyllium punctatum]